jgi:CheY-like chemotaxis protein
MTELSVIIAEDNKDDLLLVLIALKNAGYAPNYTHVQTRSELEAALQDEKWQLVMSDHTMPQFSLAHRKLLKC